METVVQLADREFCFRFYKWSLSDSKREVEQDFPFLGKMHNSRIERDLAAIRLFSQPAQFQLMKVFVKKRMKPDILSSLNEPIIPEEDKLLKEFHLNQKKVCREDPKIIKLFDDRYNDVNYRLFSRKLLKKAILENLNETFEERPSRIDSDSLIYETTFDCWTVLSTFSIQRDCLAYHHQIVGFIEKKRHVLGGIYTICLPQWLGFHHQTWCFTCEEDVQVAANTIAKLCEVFLSEIPSLLDSISLTR